MSDAQTILNIMGLTVTGAKKSQIRCILGTNGAPLTLQITIQPSMVYNFLDINPFKASFV
jgi:hypothetical protein